MKKKFFLYLLCLLSICLVGCSQGKTAKSTDNIKKVLQELFQPISNEEYQKFNDASSTPSWIEEKFKGLMTKDAYDTFLETGTYQMMLLSYENGCNIKIEEIKIDEKKDYHEFNVKLQVNYKNGNSEKFEANGTAQFDDNGQVRYFTFNNMDKIIEMLKK